jgi:hypothetical protein
MARRRKSTTPRRRSPARGFKRLERDVRAVTRPFTRAARRLMGG